MAVKIQRGINDFETWCIQNNKQLLQEWDYSRNDKQPYEYTVTSGKAVWWHIFVQKNNKPMDLYWAAPIKVRTVQNQGGPCLIGNGAF